MPVNQANLTALQAALANLLQQLVDITANPKPSYSEDGRSVSWNEFQQSLMDRISKTKNLIERENNAAVPASSVRYHKRWKQGMERSPIVGIIQRDGDCRL